ncbi:MAG: tRNA (adenosine(37)-N6)-threonylcarbamoyltransferase complex ATPase subunit type 1 TsaE [Puniceicoccaceae bacterium]
MTSHPPFPNFPDQPALTRSPEEMIALGRQFGASLPPETTLALVGDLGSGKTTFVKGLAQAFQINRTVTSPTFNLYLSYPGQRTLHHLDAYRLPPGLDLETICSPHEFSAPYCFCVEWPDRVVAFLPKDTVWLQFTIDPSLRFHRVQGSFPQATAD